MDGKVEMKTSEYLGMKPGDLDGKSYARFWNPCMVELAPHAIAAVSTGPQPAPLFTSFSDAAKLLDPSWDRTENGYALTDDDGLMIAIEIDMPHVSPAMIDWWFGWHSDESQKYKLWHPRAHVHAHWEGEHEAQQFSSNYRENYVGRVSIVHEYVGSELGEYAIQFVSPSTFGLDEELLRDPNLATAICARVGFAQFPVNAGYLIHHVRKTDRGSQMRSRFWIGKPFASARPGHQWAEPAVQLAKLLKVPHEANGRNLLVHCWQEMNHLASFLPQLYEEQASR